MRHAVLPLMGKISLLVMHSRHQENLESKSLCVHHIASISFDASNTTLFLATNTSGWNCATMEILNSSSGIILTKC